VKQYYGEYGGKELNRKDIIIKWYLRGLEYTVDKNEITLFIKNSVYMMHIVKDE